MEKMVIDMQASRLKSLNIFLLRRVIEEIEGVDESYILLDTRRQEVIPVGGKTPPDQNGGNTICSDQ